jgi:hypothetical protein
LHIIFRFKEMALDQSFLESALDMYPLKGLPKKVPYMYLLLANLNPTLNFQTYSEWA